MALILVLLIRNYEVGQIFMAFALLKPLMLNGPRTCLMSRLVLALSIGNYEVAWPMFIKCLKMSSSSICYQTFAYTYPKGRLIRKQRHNERETEVDHMD